MATDVLDPTNATINEYLLAIRDEFREAWQSGKFGTWTGRMEFQPHAIKELESGCQFRKRLTPGASKR
jgi:hypothetical protein